MIKSEDSRKEFKEILAKMLETHDKKSADYANEEDRFSNFRMCENMGLPAWKGIVVRLGDKFARICEFAKKETLQVSDESFEDTCIDMANYAILLLQAHRDYRNRQVDGDLPQAITGDCNAIGGTFRTSANNNVKKSVEKLKKDNYPNIIGVRL